MTFPNPYREDRKPAKGNREIEQGSLLLMVFRWLKVPMPLKSDAAAVERVGQLLQRRYPWMANVADAFARKSK